jgi:dTDP-4-dehydrorhamnose 3,5-epimerase-like enzyme
MTERTLAHGRVRVSPLPICRPESAGQPPLKRLLLGKGELAQIHNDARGVRMIAYTELLAGIPRGNHYHRRKQEYVYLIRGSCRLVVKDVEEGDREESVLTAGDLVLIEPGIAHAVVPLENGHALEFSESTFDPDDTIAHALV